MKAVYRRRSRLSKLPKNLPRRCPASLRIHYLLLIPSLSKRLANAQVDQTVRGRQEISDHARVDSVSGVTEAAHAQGPRSSKRDRGAYH